MSKASKKDNAPEQSSGALSLDFDLKRWTQGPRLGSAPNLCEYQGQPVNQLFR